MKGLLSVMACLTVCFCFARPTETDPTFNLKTVSKPSPTAAALGKYAEWPVNLNSGTVGVDLPLYTLTGRTLEVPVSLSYHASGIKVGEVASWVGLGWSLQAGGVITRTVRGLADECDVGYFSTRENFPDKNYTFEAPGSTPSNEWIGQVKNAVTNDIDGVHDVYTFSALGRSYRLLFKRISSGLEIQTVPYSNIKVETNWQEWSPGTGSWRVTLEDGTFLEFGGEDVGKYVEDTSNTRMSVCGTVFPSSWYLRSIKAISGETMEFTYYDAQESGTMVTSFSYSDFVTWGTLFDSYYVAPNPIGKTDVQKYSVLNLKRITSTTGYVEFGRSDVERKDFPNQLALEEIKVYRTVNAETALIDRFVLHTRQWAAAAGNDYPIIGAPDYVNWRLMLDSVTHVGTGNITTSNVKRWKLEYNSTKLPSTVSFAQDHYGYYNGVLNNPHLLPAMTVGPNNQGDYHTFTGAANRNPNPEYVGAGMLIGITYPTQGRSEFTYEANSELKNSPQIEDAEESVSLNLVQSTSPWVSQQTQTFSIGYPQTVFLQLDVTKSVGGDQQNLYVRAEITGPGTNVAINENTSMYLNAPVPGTYTLRVYTNITNGNFDSDSFLNGTATVKYTAATGPNPHMAYHGGLRIASIVDKADDDDAHDIKRSFTYSDAMVISDVSEPWDYFLDTYEEHGTYTVTRRTRNSNSQTAGISAILGYGKVTTQYGNNGENGRLESRFINNADQNDSGVLPGRPPYPEVDTKEYMRGLLRSELTFNDVGDTLTGKYYTYEFIKKCELTFFKAYLELSPYACTAPLEYCGYFPVRLSAINHQVNKTTAIESTYSWNETKETNDSLYQVTNYFYETETNTKPTTTTQVNSKGDIITVIERTYFERNQIEPALTGLDADAVDAMGPEHLNMIGIPLQKVEKLTKGSTTTHISTVTTHFKEQATDPLVVVPSRIESKIGTAASPEVRIGFIDYDASYNLIGQAKSSDISHSYVYDYNSSYPIAAATNATPSAIAFTSFEADGKGNWDFAGSGTTTQFYNGSKGYEVHTGFNPTIDDLPTNTYIVSWWAKAGASILVNGNSTGIAEVKARRGWSLFTKELSNPGTVTISGTGYIDDLRLHPKAAQMMTATFLPLVGKTSETDAAGNTTYYQYDFLNRLIAIRDDRDNMLKFFNYHFKTKSYQD